MGHGKTPCKKEKLTLNDFSKQLDEILDNLQVDKINLVGFSLGSLIALDFASNYQDKVNKLILIGTTYKRSEAAYPVSALEERKYWPPVGRVDNVYGDKNLMCSCPSMEDYD